ncbi:OmpA family protein [Sphingomonas sp. 8AM]|uniref:OmpA family protein n=1 Tax=Sphingomonas sp. 8AM TaxID=2653170 RepID=UPI0012F1A58E|nr:OmpA family protein [Sphingomonas sp. 8AM]VXD00466.1 conserved exported hypothetical protein [Sphingomonas sp. 8AM]
MTNVQWNSRTRLLAATAALCLGVAACQPGGDAVANDAAQAPADPGAAVNAALPGNDRGMAMREDATKSIIRPDIEPSPTPTPAAEPVQLTIPFPAKGVAPDAAGMTLLDGLAADPVVALGGPITIWGHSDSRGSDAANLVASRRRAEAARDYLVQKGVAADRMTVVALGEARSIAPNRQLDGSDDPEGRAKNRRVEIKVDLPGKVPATETPPR